jgi:hypothetical protein
MVIDNKFRVEKEYSGKSKHVFWHQLKKDEIIEISFLLESYNSSLTVRSGDKIFIGPTGTVCKYLQCLELIPVL